MADTLSCTSCSSATLSLTGSASVCDTTIRAATFRLPCTSAERMRLSHCCSCDMTLPAAFPELPSTTNAYTTVSHARNRRCAGYSSIWWLIGFGRRDQWMHEGYISVGVTDVVCTNMRLLVGEWSNTKRLNIVSALFSPALENPTA
jgi:hypothetical protein